MRALTPILAVLLPLLAASGCALHKPWEKALAGGAPVLIVPGEGVGNVDFGMSPEAVKRRLGPPGREDTFPGDNQTYCSWPDLGLSAQFTGASLTSLFLYSGVKGGYETRDYQPFPGRTREGLTVRSGLDQVLAVYGTPEEQGDLPDAPIPARWFTYREGIGFMVVQDSNAMIQMYLVQP